MNKLEQYLNLASRAYYSGAPIITDDQFDRLAESIGYNAVGAKQHGNVERHVYQMYSLQKYYEDENQKRPLDGISDILLLPSSMALLLAYCMWMATLYVR